MPATNLKYVAHTATGGGSTPATTNDGLCRFGWAQTGLTFTTATRTLVDVGAWASYTWTAGDRVGILSGTGVTAGSYEIASRPDADSIVLVEDIGGTNPSDVATSTGPWGDATEDTVGLQYAVDNAGASDRVSICNDSAWSLNATVDFDTVSGAADGGPVYRGATANGLPDGTQARIDMGALGASVDGFTIGINSWRGTLMDLEITGDLTDPATLGGGGRYGVHVVNTLTNVVSALIRVRVHHTGDTAVYNGSEGGQMLIKDSTLDHTGANGYEVDSGTMGLVALIGSSLHHNTNNGALLGGNNGWNVLERVLTYQNAQSGIASVSVTNARISIDHITAYGNAAAGIDLAQNAGTLIHSSSISGSGTHGIGTPLANWSRITESRTNLFFENGSGRTEWNTDEVPDDPFGDNVEADPEYLSVVTGSEILVPAEGSPMIKAAIAAQTQ